MKIYFPSEETISSSPFQVCNLILKFWRQRLRETKSCCRKKSRKWCIGYRQLEKKRCKKLLYFRKRSVFSSHVLKLLFPFRISIYCFYFKKFTDILLWFYFFVCARACVHQVGTGESSLWAGAAEDSTGSNKNLQERRIWRTSPCCLAWGGDCT